MQKAPHGNAGTYVLSRSEPTPFAVLIRVVIIA